MSILQAFYFDGKSSRRHPVSILVGGGKLKIIGRDVTEVFDAQGVRRSLRVGSTPRWLYLPGDGVCVTADNDAVDRMTQDRRYERALHQWESRPAYAAIAFALVAGALWWLIERAVPVAVNYAAEHIPMTAESALGRETLSGLERQMVRPSRLSAARQAALRAKFDAMVRAADEKTPYRLEFRASPALGPNAFALPSGIIVMMDELVKRANNDQEILGVLAHELGHVRHRHTMRRLLEGSATALIIASVTGDIASATSLAAAAPTLLLQTKYSRNNEHEADVYAIHMMRNAGYDPGHLAAILGRIEGKRAERGSMPTFLSSHPPTTERAALARAGTLAEVPAADIIQAEDEGATETLVPDKPKSAASDPEQREILALFEQRNYAELERVLGDHQRAFEADAGSSQKLETAFQSFGKVPRSEQEKLNEWIKQYPASYAALTARASFYHAQGMDARGTAYFASTPEENIRTMRVFLEKSQLDSERALTLTPKPYFSHFTLMSIAGTTGGDGEKEHYLEAVKLAPQSVELRLARMAKLAPRWGGSYREMEAFAKEARAQLKDPVAANRIASRIPVARGLDLQGDKKYSQALTQFNEAVALYPSPSALCNRSYVLSQLNRDDEAFADVKLALAKSREYRYCLERAVPATTKINDADEAIAVLSIVIEADSGMKYAFNQRGWRYQKQGKTDLAYQDYLASAKLGEPWGQLMAGKYLWAGTGVKTDREEAIEWMRKAAAQGHPDAKLTLKQALEQLAKK